MNVIQAGSSAVPILAEMNKRLIEDERHPNLMNVEQLAQRMAGWLNSGYTCYLAIKQDRPVAYCLYRDEGDYYYLRHLFVERQDRRQGIATGLLDWMYGNVWVRKRVRLDVLSHNEGAISFYRAYGFQVGCLRMEK